MNRQVLTGDNQAAIETKSVECDKGGGSYQFKKNSAGIFVKA